MTDHVYGDAMAFGMGSCALQITFQAQSEQEACKLYDQLATLTPILVGHSLCSLIFSLIDCYTFFFHKVLEFVRSIRLIQVGVQKWMFRKIIPRIPGSNP